MLRTKKIILLVTCFLLAGIAVFAIAHNSGGKDKQLVTLYFLSADKSTITGYEEEFSEEDNGLLYKAVAESLIKGPKSNRYTAVIESDTELKSIKNEDGKLTVDFSKNFKKTELLAVYAVIKTFSQLPDVESVKVTADGKDILGCGFVASNDINLESDDDCALTVHLYFADEDKNKLVGEYRKINILDTQQIEQYIVAELIKGPNVKGHERLLPKNTEIVSVETTDGTCYVNFKKSVSSEASRELMIYSIVNSLTERSGVDCVQFLVDGKKIDGSDSPKIAEPLYRNEKLIEKN